MENKKSHSAGYKNIILMDDSELNNLLNMQFLNFTMPDARIVSYEDPKLLLGLLVHGSIALPDLILLDVMMPEIDGWEFLDTLKENNLDVEVIMLSSSTHHADLDKIKNYPSIKGYIEKPLTEEKIVGQIVKVGEHH